MPPEAEDRAPGLTRASLVTAALSLVHEAGLDALTMRALADRLGVKAASLYWHVRDRNELVELLADSILAGVHGTPSGPWRSVARGTALALAARVAAQRDGARILLEVPDALQRSAPYSSVKESLQGAGLQPTEAGDVAFMLMVHVIVDHATGKPPLPESGVVASIAVDSGSRGIVLRHGSDMESLIRVPQPASSAPAIVRGETVKVRRLRGVGVAEIELNPRHPWRFQIQGPTWNTVLHVGGLDVREIKLDSGAAKVECFLPRPHGVVPIIVSGGVVGVTLHRPAGAAVIADAGPGSVRLKLDAFAVSATTADLHWESDGASRSADRYELRINGGAVQVTLDDQATDEPSPSAPAQPEALGEVTSALEILLDGVERRIMPRR
ncbi:MAG TPA: TetR family transcriptional regulator [Candidatus Acidoferrum sp.]|nr:TetR family transcriptional regulator [Candidatus Acidoferrum sp.]